MNDVDDKINFVQLDVRDENVKNVYYDQDFVFHLACPAATAVFTKDRVGVLDINYIGMKHLLEAAKKKRFPVLFTSSSEVYGDVNTVMKEDDRGQVNFRGIRSAYDEGKRVCETMIAAYKAEFRLRSVYTVRLFNTYGGRMTPNGRLIPTVIKDIVNKGVVTIFGDGAQTRTLNYIEDTLDAMFLVVEKGCEYPINIGGVEERTILSIAHDLCKILERQCKFECTSLPIDEPMKRKPDISRLMSLGYLPKTTFQDGVLETYRVMKKEGWI